MPPAPSVPRTWKWSSREFGASFMAGSHEVCHVRASRDPGSELGTGEWLRSLHAGARRPDAAVAAGYGVHVADRVREARAGGRHGEVREGGAGRIRRSLTEA